MSTSSSIRSPAPSAPAVRINRSTGSGGWYCAGTTRSPMALLDLFGELADDLEQIPHDPVIGHLEDRRVSAPVDGHDDFGRAHSGEVLDRPRNAGRPLPAR